MFDEQFFWDSARLFTLGITNSFMQVQSLPRMIIMDEIGKQVTYQDDLLSSIILNNALQKQEQNRDTRNTLLLLKDSFWMKYFLLISVMQLLLCSPLPLFPA